MVSTLSLISESSTVSLMYSGRLFRPTGCGSFSESIWNPNLVAITTLARHMAETSRLLFPSLRLCIVPILYPDFCEQLPGAAGKKYPGLL